MNIDNLEKILKQDDIILEPQALDQLDNYKNMIQLWNTKFNLTGNSSDEFIFMNHFLDAIKANFLINNNFEYNSCLDFGTGAGLPGIVFAILNPDKSYTLLDSNNKKITFLKEVIDKLNLNNISLVNERVENLIEEQKFDLCISRGVAKLGILLELCCSCIKIGGTIISMKGPNFQEEINQFKNMHINLGLKEGIVLKYGVLELSRTLVCYQKTQNNSPKYPRKYSVIKASYKQ